MPPPGKVLRLIEAKPQPPPCMGPSGSLVERGSDRVLCRECKEWRSRLKGCIDPEDGEWYCDACWVDLERQQRLQQLRQPPADMVGTANLQLCAECGVWARDGAIDPEDSEWYCRLCWDALEVEIKQELEVAEAAMALESGPTQQEVQLQVSPVPDKSHSSRNHPHHKLADASPADQGSQLPARSCDPAAAAPPQPVRDLARG